jgi:NAD(P)H-hydrate epimerase
MFPDQVYTARQCRELDLLAIAAGVSGYALMCRAGAAACALLLDTWPQPAHIHIVCGAGNNGGDGLVVARLAHQQQLPVTVHFLGDSAKLQGEALQAWQDATAAGVVIRALDTQIPLAQGVVVDALLGIGLTGNVRENADAAIHWINRSGLPVLALDIPSGICADTGRVLGTAVKACKTITFIAAKRGLYTGGAVDYTGAITLASLDVPEALYSRTGPSVAMLSADKLLPQLPARPRNAHKGLYGHLLVIGGNRGMAGAALMAARAAARSGAGLVSVATLPEHLPAFISQQPELMVHGVSNVHQLADLLGKATVVVAGPGLGQDAWAEQMLMH